MLKRYRAAALCLLCLIIGCNSNPTDNPPTLEGMPLRFYTQEPSVPFPDFIYGVSYIEFKQSRLQICVYISQENVWEPGDYAETLDEKIRLNSELKIDDAASQLDEPCLIPGNLFLRHDEQGNLLGTFGDPTCLCTTKQRDGGEHQGFIEIRMPSGKEYSHIWTFEG
jgi:hypothetical protein